MNRRQFLTTLPALSLLALNPLPQTYTFAGWYKSESGCPAWLHLAPYETSRQPLYLLTWTSGAIPPDYEARVKQTTARLGCGFGYDTYLPLVSRGH